MIPMSHNHAGFPDGISGIELLARMKAKRYGQPFEAGRSRRCAKSTTCLRRIREWQHPLSDSSFGNRRRQPPARYATGNP